MARRHWPITFRLSTANSGGRAVPDLVLGHGFGPALVDQQARLGAVESLDLRLLVYRQHQAMRRRVEIEPKDFAQLGGKGRILRQLKATHPVWLQTVHHPDPSHQASAARAVGRRHRHPGPVRRLAGRFAYFFERAHCDSASKSSSDLAGIALALSQLEP